MISEKKLKQHEASLKFYRSGPAEIHPKDFEELIAIARAHKSLLRAIKERNKGVTFSAKDS